MSTIESPEGSARPPGGRAASPPGIEIRTLSDAREMSRAVEVFQEVWGADTELVRLEMMMAISHSGGYVCAAFDTQRDGTMIGASVGLLARHREQAALHSHVTGVVSGVQHSGIGRAMKSHQRDWAAARGIDWIVWTFDPLVRRNAWFNVAVLGVEVRKYLVSFYGVMDDAINAGDESDRLLVEWYVPTAGERPPRDGRDTVPGSDLVATPEDIVALRRTDPAAVAAWRAETRAGLAGALAAGRRITGFTCDGNYVIGPA